MHPKPGWGSLYGLLGTGLALLIGSHFVAIRGVTAPEVQLGLLVLAGLAIMGWINANRAAFLAQTQAEIAGETAAIAEPEPLWVDGVGRSWSSEPAAPAVLAGEVRA